jgi:hypothetical protein
MRSLELSIAEWRQNMSAARGVVPDTLDELESHLRETVEQLMRSGVSEAEAFQCAVTQLGSPAVMAREFRKLSAFNWSPVRVIGAVWVVAILTQVCNFHPPLGRTEWGIVMTVVCMSATIGYGTAILHGLFGACFVMQRCLSDSSPRRLQALCRVSRSFAWVAAGLTVVFGAALGEIWSQWVRHEGFWLQVQAWSVVVWLVSFLAAHYWRAVSARGLFMASLLGSNIILWSLFGPYLDLGLHSSENPMQLLWMFVGAPLWILNALLFLVGLAPAGWLRLRKA